MTDANKPAAGTDTQWQAVLARDRDADGQFVYAVTSTGIFCRPSCHSRRPRRDRVRFFDTPTEARAAGFRPCLRCRPEDAPAADPWPARIEHVCRLIERAERPPSLATLAQRVGSSRYHFLRHFTRAVGVTPHAFAEARRFAAVRHQLRTGADVTRAMLDAGYASSSRFYASAAPRLAMAPASYRAGGAGQVVRYATTASPLGRLLVAATPKGVCSVTLGDSDVQLESALRREYPRAEVVRAPRAVRTWVRHVVAHLHGREPQLDLPLDIRATAFQWQVWNALRDIPPGETRTYSDVAATIGRPAAARAVARACASNPVALAVPCHRVVPVAGGTGGYRWGRERKEALLARERKTVA